MHVLTILIAAAVSTPAAAVDSRPIPGKPGGSDNPVVCRREVPVGSLIASRKICMTKSEWEIRATRGNEEARKQIEDNTSRNATPSH